jgi:putative CocE/NonD family hydrolase
LPGTTQFTINSTRNVMVPMRDGVRLATDIYRPADENGNVLEGEFPVILGRTSYDKSNPVIWVDAIAGFFVPRGYVVLLQDLRGRGQSEGTGQYFHTANPLEGKDGYDTIEWAAAQPWCNGKVGMVGASHGGIVQNMASLERPPHLAALWVDVAPTNAFMWEARQGGAMGLHMYGALYLHGYDSHELRGNTEATTRIERGAENLRSELMRLLREPLRPGETPIAAVPNLEKILFHYYYDGVYNDFWSQECLDHSPHFDRMADIPAVYSSGWYDPFPADVTEQYTVMARKNSTPQRLVVGPWNHVLMRGRGSSSVGEVEFGSSAKWGDRVFNAERLRWFDRWLKGTETEVEKDAPVRIFVMGGGSGRKDVRGHIEHGGAWREEQEWPLTRTSTTELFLRAGGGLSGEKGKATDKPVTWTHDPQRPVPSVGANVTGMYEWVPLNEGLDPAYIPQRARMKSVIPDGPLHQRERADLLCCEAPYPLLADRPDVMVFQTDPLEHDIEVTGAPKVRLWISSSAPDTDFTAKLLDIYPASDDWPDGFHLPLADSIIRARFREGFDAERLMATGQVYEVEIELPPISNLFVKGHRIRIDISSSNFPRFDVNPNTGEPLGRHTRFEKAQNTVYLDKNRPSHVTLPVIP